MTIKNGRPPKPIDELRSETVEIRINTVEKKGFQNAASIAGVSLSVWARERLRRVASRELEEARQQVPFINLGK